MHNMQTSIFFKASERMIPRNLSALHANNIILLVFLFVFAAGCDLTGTKDEAGFYQQLAGPCVVHDWISATIRPDGTIWTWGNGTFGTLGRGSLESSDLPVNAIGIHNSVAIDLNAGIAVSADDRGNIYFWGDHFIFLEPPDLDTIVVIPTIVSHLNGIHALVIGIIERFYFLVKNGTVWYVQHDHNKPTTYMKPYQVEGISDAVQISVCYALKANGSLFDIVATIPDLTSPPLNRGGPIPDLKDIIQVESVWQRRTVILKRDGTVWAWGWNDFGQLGDSTFQDSEVPVRVGDLTDIIAISAHYDYNLALKNDGTVWFWGLEIPGEKKGTSIPVKIQNLKAASVIYATYNSLVLCEDGTLWTFDAGSKIPEEIPFP
jgi:hypothetical protein